MIEEIGTVIAVEIGKATIRTERSTACEGCASAGFCNLSEGGESVTVVAEDPLHVSVGQTVRVAIPTESFLKGTFLLYLFPLVGLFAGMAAGVWFSVTYHHGEKDLMAAAGALSGLVLFFAFQRLLNRRIARSRDFRPIITEILSSSS
jgi:sigma-E factor negative regulatory protein RseC